MNGAMRDVYLPRTILSLFTATVAIGPLVGPAWQVTYTFDQILASSSVIDALDGTEGASPDARRLLFGDVIIRNDSADVAWLASAPSILVLGLNTQVGVDGPGSVGRVFGKTDRTSLLKLIEFGEQGLVVSDAGNINGSREWHCPSVSPVHRICHDVETQPPLSREELDRLLTLADRGQAFERFHGFQFRGRFVDRQHVLPTQINKFGQVVFIDPLGDVPNAIFIATPVVLGMRPGLVLAAVILLTLSICRCDRYQKSLPCP
jgi:hypothetical protein